MDWLVKPCRHKTIGVQQWSLLAFCALLVVPLSGRPQRGVPTVPSLSTPDYHNSDVDEIDLTTEESNVTDGFELGAPCESACNPKLANVYCDPVTRHCECDKKFPVRLSPTRGCAKPVRLGDQCFYAETCTFTDQNAACIQIQHNAFCQCKPGYHTVTTTRPNKRIFCSEDMILLTTDLPTLFGVATGLAIFTGLICFVLKLFSSARYTRPRHYANANLAPPILFSSDTGSRRPSLASLHSNASSTRSYSMRRFEREHQQREQRQLQLQENLRLSTQPDTPALIPSPKTPQSTDELLPAVCERGEEGYSMAISGASDSIDSDLAISGYQGEIGPCTSSDHQ